MKLPVIGRSDELTARSRPAFRRRRRLCLLCLLCALLVVAALTVPWRPWRGPVPEVLARSALLSSRGGRFWIISTLAEHKQLAYPYRGADDYVTLNTDGPPLLWRAKGRALDVVDPATGASHFETLPGAMIAHNLDSIYGTVDYLGGDWVFESCASGRGWFVHRGGRTWSITAPAFVNGRGDAVIMALPDQRALLYDYSNGGHYFVLNLKTGALARCSPSPDGRGLADPVAHMVYLSEDEPTSPNYPNSPMWLVRPHPFHRLECWKWEGSRFRLLRTIRFPRRNRDFILLATDESEMDLCIALPGTPWIICTIEDLSRVVVLPMEYWWHNYWAVNTETGERVFLYRAGDSGDTPEAWFPPPGRL